MSFFLQQKFLLKSNTFNESLTDLDVIVCKQSYTAAVFKIFFGKLDHLRINLKWFQLIYELSYKTMELSLLPKCITVSQPGVVFTILYFLCIF